MPEYTEYGVLSSTVESLRSRERIKEKKEVCIDVHMHQTDRQSLLGPDKGYLGFTQSHRPIVLAR